MGQLVRTPAWETWYILLLLSSHCSYCCLIQPFSIWQISLPPFSSLPIWVILAHEFFSLHLSAAQPRCSMSTQPVPPAWCAMRLTRATTSTACHLVSTFPTPSGPRWCPFPRCPYISLNLGVPKFCGLRPLTLSWCHLSPREPYKNLEIKRSPAGENTKFLEIKSMMVWHEVTP